jgi:hypothetical protein
MIFQIIAQLNLIESFCHDKSESLAQQWQSSMPQWHAELDSMKIYALMLVSVQTGTIRFWLLLTWKCGLTWITQHKVIQKKLIDLGAQMAKKKSSPSLGSD